MQEAKNITEQDINTSGYQKFLDEGEGRYAARLRQIEETLNKCPDSTYTILEKELTMSIKQWHWDSILDRIDAMGDGIDVDVGYSDETSVGLSSSEPYIQGVGFGGSDASDPQDMFIDAVFQDLHLEVGLILDDDNPIDRIMALQIWCAAYDHFSETVERAC